MLIGGEMFRRQTFKERQQEIADRKKKQQDAKHKATCAKKHQQRHNRNKKHK